MAIFSKYSFTAHFMVPVFLASAALQTGCASRSSGGSAVSANYWISFAGGFESGGVCGDEPAGSPGGTGCDIYRARLDGSTFDVLSIDRLTSGTEAEVFPAITADGSKVYYHTVDSTSSRSLHVVDAETGATQTLLSQAEYADVFDDGRVVFTDMSAGNPISILTLDDSGNIGANTSWTSMKPALDVNLAPDGGAAVFHVTGCGTDHGVHVLDTGSGQSTLVTASTGAGHCTISPSHERVVCDSSSGSGVQGFSFSGGVWSSDGTIIADPTGLGESDSDFAGCSITSADFPAFCDETHVIFSVSCVKNGATDFSKVFLADISVSPATLRAVGSELAEKVGGSGRTSWTPSCRTATN